jgi:hypothetical protein
MKRALLLCAALAMLAGCTGAPDVAEPVAQSRLESLAGALGSGMPAAGSYRGAGSGEIGVSGRTLDVAFAVVYERPGWLRADLRPALGTLGSSLTSLALMEGECARLYLPARLLVVSGCISDIAGFGGQADPASLILGLPDASFITGLTDVTSTHRRGRLVLDGLSGDTRVRVTIDEEKAVITGIELGHAGTNEELSITYEGHGWKEAFRAPRTVELVALEGTSREVRIAIRYDSLRTGEPVERADYDLGVPQGALEINWRELDLWR